MYASGAAWVETQLKNIGMWATEIFSWTSQRWRKELQSHLKGRGAAMDKTDCTSSKCLLCLALQCAVGIAASPGEAPPCSHGQLSAHPMQPLLGPHRGKIHVQFLPFCPRVPVGVSAVPALGSGGVCHGTGQCLSSKPCYCHSPSGLSASRVSCLVRLKC